MMLPGSFEDDDEFTHASHLIAPTSGEGERNAAADAGEEEEEEVEAADVEEDCDAAAVAAWRKASESRATCIFAFMRRLRASRCVAARVCSGFASRSSAESPTNETKRRRRKRCHARTLAQARVSSFLYAYLTCSA